MKDTDREMIQIARPIWAAVALSILLAAAGLQAEQRPSASPQPAPAVSRCISSSMNVARPGVAAANIPMTAAQGAAILRELRAIRLLLQNGAASRAVIHRTPAAPQNVKLRIEPDWHVLGSPNAPVTMVEFTDLQCPFCRRFQTTTFATLKKDYIDTGKVRFIARDMPLPMHQYALGAAEAERCAGDQDKFWQFRNAVLNDQVPPTSDILLKHAQALNLNLEQFQACLKGNKYSQLIQADRASAAALGIRGVPAFVIGRVKGGWINGISMSGARPLPFFQHEIGIVLNGSPASTAKLNLVESANRTSRRSSVAKVTNQ